MRMPLFRGAKRWMIVLTGMLLASILLSACGENSPSILDTAGPVAEREGFVFWVILIIATIIFVLVESMLIFSIIRFRERPGMANPPQIHGSLRIEILWTVIPAFILFIVLGFTIQGLFAVAPSARPAGPTVEVEAIGHQWWWEFYYPQYKITTADNMNVPVGQVVHVTLYSNNVIHSFWVPNLTGKTDLIPGHNNEKWFKADRAGKYLGICAEFCGAQHANMKFEVRATAQDEFQTWVTTQQQAVAAPSGGGLATEGAQLFQNQCSTCHGIVGVNQAGYIDTRAKCDDPNVNDTNNCKVGPNLTHFASRDQIAGGVLSHDATKCQDPENLQDCNLAKWLADPQGIKPGNDMQVNLTKDQIKALVAYLETLK